MLDAIKIVLVEPSHPGNIGAAARAMKNMGLSQLVLVNPEKFPHMEATVRASGADNLLKNAEVVTCLNDALADCQLAFGTSARTRALPWPLYTPRESAELIAGASDQKIAIVFGRECSGLTNEELGLCQYHIHIPVEEDFSSLNLASAVLLVAYELRISCLKPRSKVLERDSELASLGQLNGLSEHCREVMIKLGMLNPNQPKKLIMRIQRLLNRSELEVNELNILRGFLSAVDKHLK